MNGSAIFLFGSFYFLISMTLAIRERRLRALNRTTTDWLLDIIGLVVQGIVLPLLQVLCLSKVLAYAFPQWLGVWEIPGPLAFALNFTLIDYLYYWNHRGLHLPRIWFIHRVHHTVTDIDVLATSRNSLWTPLFIVNIWAQSLLVFLLAHPVAFVWGLALSNALDLWRHSGFRTPVSLRRTVGSVLILPEDHEWHHSRNLNGVNFGANLNIWDRLHRTFYRAAERPEQLGTLVTGSFVDRLFRPWRLQ